MSVDIMYLANIEFLPQTSNTNWFFPISWSYSLKKHLIFTLRFVLYIELWLMETVSWGTLCTHHHIVIKLVIVKNQFFFSNGMTFFIAIFLPLTSYS